MSALTKADAEMLLSSKSGAPQNAAPVADDQDQLDWDEALINGSPRAAGTIRVRLAFQGREKPPIVEAVFTWEEQNMIVLSQTCDMVQRRERLQKPCFAQFGHARK